MSSVCTSSSSATLRLVSLVHCYYHTRAQNICRTIHPRVASLCQIGIDHRDAMYFMYGVGSLSLLTLSNAFYLPVTYRPRKTVGESQAHKKNISGSFFNPIPNRDDEGEDNQMEHGNDSSPNYTADITPPMDPFDQSLAELRKKNQNVPNSSSPSSSMDRGIPPPIKAMGFGKAKGIPETNLIQTVSKKSFVGIGKPLNDITKPEYDEQGYTLYADEETGERRRVFEALVQYPCQFTMKIIGDPKENFAAEIVQVVAQTCEVTFEAVSYSERKYGKWISVTVKAPVTSAEMLYSIYENIDKDPRVKFKF